MTSSENVSRRAFIQRLGALGLVGIGAGTLLTGCGGGGGSSAPAKEITLTPLGNEMRYEQTEFAVRPGQEVQITFDNTATSPSMQHNVVVLNSNDDDVVKRVGEGGMQAGLGAEYVPDDPAVLAATEVAPPGEEVTVSFTAPEEPGEYRYVCTFPGHWPTMQGTMQVSSDAA